MSPDPGSATGLFSYRLGFGDVSVSVLPGTGVYMDVRTLSGSTHTDLDVGDAPPAGQNDPASMLSLRLQTASGDISVMRAPTSQKVSHT